jgi:hypothetical protein
MGSRRSHKLPVLLLLDQVINGPGFGQIEYFTVETRLDVLAAGEDLAAQRVQGST